MSYHFHVASSIHLFIIFFFWTSCKKKDLCILLILNIDRNASIMSRLGARWTLEDDWIRKGSMCRLVVKTMEIGWRRSPEVVEFVENLTNVREWDATPNPRTFRVPCLATEMDANARHLLRKIFRHLSDEIEAHDTCSRWHWRLRVRFCRPLQTDLIDLIVPYEWLPDLVVQQFSQSFRQKK